MSTITPTSDQRKIDNRSVFNIGDEVQGVDGRIGTITNDPGQIETVISVDPGPPYVVTTALRNVVAPPLPFATPSPPPTNNVIVEWVDGTKSTVLLSSLKKVGGL